tara:strand:+ start:2023 stop:2973 length:951 start_codon:yes stop_codon:yes gene_type:complete
MPTKHHPHRGSMQFWPRARSSKSTARVNTWNTSKEDKVEGFLGYKVGMTHLLFKEKNSKSPRHDMNVFCPCTVIECPPMKVYSIRFYKEIGYGPKVVSEIFSKKVDKELSRKVKVSKKDNKEPEDYDYFRLVVYTQPKLMGMGKKKPDMVEVGITDNLDYAKSLLDKEVKISDVHKEGTWVDVHGVTTGKGFSGVVKKFGVKVMSHKAEKTKRGIGTMGAWTTKKVQYTVAQPGKFGYHLRTEYNKLCLKIGDKPEEINPKGGFVKYGLVKNDYLLIHGSVVGPTTRPITITSAIRPKKKAQAKEINYVSLESKQR